MQAVVTPSFVFGTVAAPASKSAMQRACAAALIKSGKTILHNPGISDDDKAALDIIQKLGAIVERVNETIIVTSNGVHPVSEEINCGESGLSVRLFTSVAALSDQQVFITGKGSLTKRPLHFFDEIFPLLKVKCKSNNGLLPLQIQGPLIPVNIEIDGSLSSQFLTGLLFAYAAFNACDVTIRVKNLSSKPYIDLSLKILEAFGLKSPVNKEYKEFYFPRHSVSTYQNQAINYKVEGDWSGASFLLVAGTIAGNVTVTGLDIFSTQADRAILEALKLCGALVNINDDHIEVSQTSSLKGFYFNATDCPDLFPPLVALASCCEGVSVIEGVQRLQHKESDRAKTLQEEFRKMGVQIEVIENKMQITGTNNILATSVHSHHDHRIAMACAVAALRADGNIIIENADAVNKSYPAFWEHFYSLQKQTR